MKVIGKISKDSADVEYIDGTLVMLTEYENEQLQRLVKACNNSTEAFAYICEFSSIRNIINRFGDLLRNLEELTGKNNEL